MLCERERERGFIYYPVEDASNSFLDKVIVIIDT